MSQLFKPAPSHNPLLGPAVCLCVDCCRIVAKLRCPAISGAGHQCGNYKHRGNEHWLIIATVFQIVNERLATADDAGQRKDLACTLLHHDDLPGGA